MKKKKQKKKTRRLHAVFNLAQNNKEEDLEDIDIVVQSDEEDMIIENLRNKFPKIWQQKQYK